MTKFTDTAKKYIPRLMDDLSLERHQASGLFGNIGGETGGLTALQEKNPTVKNSRGGYGWLQWTGPRRRAFEKWAKDHNLSIAEDETNYAYIVYEMKGTERSSLLKLRKTKTIEEATESFMKNNLRPGIPHLEGRIKWALKANSALSANST